jgi:hypothetical protein
MPLNYTTRLISADRFKNDLALRVRSQVVRQFLAEIQPIESDLVANFGATGNCDHPVHYFFEELYPHKDKITAIARPEENAGWLADAFPGLTFLEADLRHIPLPDNYFDAGLCNAVVEHAGPKDQQIALVHEVCRVCKCVMFTTPNKGFPIELHTFLPFLHWLPDTTYRRVLKKLGFEYFADIEVLNLLDAPSFMGLFPKSRHNRLIKMGLPLLPSNLVCISSIA